MNSLIASKIEKSKFKIKLERNILEKIGGLKSKLRVVFKFNKIKNRKKKKVWASTCSNEILKNKDLFKDRIKR